MPNKSIHCIKDSLVHFTRHKPIIFEECIIEKIENNKTLIYETEIVGNTY